MKKFKEFYVQIPNNQELRGALLSQSSNLGYMRFKFPETEYCTYGFNGYGGVGANTGGRMSGISGHKLTLEEFFALTPEDVVVEPERFEYAFYHISEKRSEIYRITKDQIDRVQEILNGVNHEY